MIEEKPLLILGVPGILFLFSGIWFGAWLLQVYSEEHYVVTNMALASLSLILIGFFMISTGVTLYAISRMSKRISFKS